MLKVIEVEGRRQVIHVADESADAIDALVASRAIRNETVIAASSDAAGMAEIFNFAPVYAGKAVTQRTAMTLSAVYRCVAIIAGSIAALPLGIFEREYEKKQALRREVEQSPLWFLLNEQPTPLCTAAVFWEWHNSIRLLRGDSFALIVRDGYGTPVELLPLLRDCVQVVREPGANRLTYHVALDEGRRFMAVDQADMLHFCNLGFNGLTSLSVIEYAARQSVGIALAAEEHSGRMFSNGANPSVVIRYEKDVTQPQLDDLRNKWADRYAGAGNVGKPLILTNGAQVQALSLSPGDMQLIESRRFQVVDIARAFGVPPHMLGETEKTTSWGTGVSEMGQGFINYTLLPHLVRDQQELNRKLFKTSRNFVEWDRSALLAGDRKALADYYRQAIGGSQGPGWMTVNEVRRRDNLPPAPAGDVLFNPNSLKAPDNAKAA